MKKSAWKLSPRQWRVKIVGMLVLMLSGSAAAFLIIYWLLPLNIHYHITETYAFDGPPGEAALAVLLPSSGPYQQVSAVEVQWPGAQEMAQTGSLQIIKLTGSLPEGATRAVIDFDVSLRQGPARWDGAVAPEDTQPQPEIESDALEIKALTEELGAGQDSPAVYRRFANVAARLNWPTGSRINVKPSALQALLTGEGGCNEFANLLVAVNRAAGVPAHTVSGLVVSPYLIPFTENKATWSHPAGAHAWSELYIADVGWIMADSSWAGSFLPGRYYGYNDGGHLAYSEVYAEAAVYEELMTWAKTRGELRSAMSAPLKFVAAHSSQDVEVTPSVSMRKTWDGRWLAFLILLAVLGVSGSALDRLVNRIK